VDEFMAREANMANHATAAVLVICSLFMWAAIFGQ
jgi:hypothetical protein